MSNKCKKRLILITYVISAMVVSCSSSGQKAEIKNKNICFDIKLEALRFQSIYRDVMSQFVDTFEVLETRNRIFGQPNVVSNKVDGSVFFNSKKNECLLLVLQKFTNKLLFGQVRLIRGRYVNGKWIFKPSMVYTFDPDILKDYEENSFEVISKLGRYSVLTAGETIKDGCEIDEEYWFKLMPTN